MTKKSERLIPLDIWARNARREGGRTSARPRYRLAEGKGRGVRGRGVPDKSKDFRLSSQEKKSHVKENSIFEKENF